jgi:hypothetical protein
MDTANTDLKDGRKKRKRKIGNEVGRKVARVMKQESKH